MRVIDADRLKEHIDKLPALPDGNFAGNHSALKALINMQPTVEPERKPGKWIPCSELLPEYNQRVLVLEDTDYVFIAKRVKAEDNRLKEESWLDDDGYPFAFSNCHVIKWMSLPESYKEE